MNYQWLRSVKKREKCELRGPERLQGDLSLIKNNMDSPRWNSVVGIFSQNILYFRNFFPYSLTVSVSDVHFFWILRLNIGNTFNERFRTDFAVSNATEWTVQKFDVFFNNREFASLNVYVTNNLNKRIRDFRLDYRSFCSFLLDNFASPGSTYQVDIKNAMPTAWHARSVYRVIVLLVRDTRSLEKWQLFSGTTKQKYYPFVLVINSSERNRFEIGFKTHRSTNTIKRQLHVIKIADMHYR